ncbi:MAG: adenylate cyclase [Mycobacterium sp.]
MPVDGQTGYRWSHCVPARPQHYADRVSQRLRILKFTAWIAAAISGSFATLQFFGGPDSWWIGLINLVAAVAFVATPTLYRYGELIAPLTFICVAYATIFVVCWVVGTRSGLQFYFLAAASIMVLIIGVEHIALVAAVAGVGVSLVIVLEFSVPADTGSKPAWLLTASFVSVIASACLMVVATIWFALREITRAEAAMEVEYHRSEALLSNILPASVAERLKNSTADIISDSYADASVLIADIADFTQRASQTDPRQLVEFLNRLYTDLDRLVERHGLEKIKTTGDSYMVVSGVPEPRPDHLQALARLALDIADTVTGLRDPLGRPVSLRIGLAAGPVVAGVVGTRRFFYDVWGDAVNLAARMESTDQENRIQVPQNVFDRLSTDFVFEERGAIDVKGKGVMRTWYLVGERPRSDQAPQQLSSTPAR